MTVDDVATADEIALLRQAVREVMNSLYSGWPDERWPQSWPANWETLARQGLWSTIEPPDGSLAMAAVVVEELGRALYPGPACEALAANYVLNRLGDVGEHQPVAGGHGPVVFVTGDVSSDARSAADQIIHPTVYFTPDTMLMIAIGQDELFLLPAAAAESYNAPSLDVSRRITQSRLGAQSASGLVLADADVARRGRAARDLLYCADTLGCVDHVIARTTDYARQRTTFGSPIGKYQAVAHRLVDHTVTATQMRLVLEGAIEAFDDRRTTLESHMATVETFFSGRGAEIVSDCIQLAGAIGFTWEFGHHFYLRRVVQNSSLGGGDARPHQRLAREAQW